MDNLPAIPDDPRNKIHALISQALQSNAGIDALERLAALMEKADARFAEQQFDTAMSAFQAECPIIYKTVQGAKSRYAPIDEIISKIQPLLGKYGFSFTIDVDHSLIKDGLLIVMCTVNHVDGHKRKVSVPTAILPGNKATNYTHDVAGTITYGSRYAIRNAFGVVTTDPDPDAHIDIPALVGKVEELMVKVPDGKMRVDEVLVKRGVTSISELKPNVLVYLINYFQKKLEAHE